MMRMMVVAVLTSTSLISAGAATSAAEPDRVELSRTRHRVTFTGGPYYVPNWTDECPAIPIELCDVLELSVRTKTPTRVMVKVASDEGFADYNLRIRTSDGTVVREDLGTELDASVVFMHRPGAGPYMVEVVPYSQQTMAPGSWTGSSYHGVARLLTT